MKVLFVPLDERPCNHKFPQLINDIRDDVELVVPSLDLLGYKKKATDVENLWKFVFENASKCDYAILSIDTLVYGGLIPSRIHNLSFEKAKSYLENIKELKKINPNIKIYAFNCIMRSPQYNSSEEEPDYYEDYGYNLFKRAYLIDKKERNKLTKDEKKELKSIKIPKEILKDYENRRNFNLDINIEVTKLVKEGVIDFLTIPQDDSSEYGYTAIAQRKVIKFIEDNKLEFNINVYPGADEVGCSLMARALNDYLDRTLKIYPFYASTLGPTIVPLYEDRPMNESLKYHVRVCKAEIVNSEDEADIILAINCPGKDMQESFDQLNRLDLTYSSHRNLQDFVYKIKKYIDKGKKVIVCDSAFSNGGDLKLIDFMDRLSILDRIVAYAGWNTNCNTLGTTLATGIYGFDHAKNNINITKNIVYRIVEDVLYQSVVRQNVIEGFLKDNGLSIYDFKDKGKEVEREIKDMLREEYNKLQISKLHDIDIKRVYMPWKRMFEVGLEISIDKK
ncbi:DUF4127 family protein [Clostridium oceanicum]|uniref:DUF4127 family protein n=1 Tax=Clostridium oceanicum TaxID=1543 RepID=A0ABN1JDF1_9CLOT